MRTATVLPARAFGAEADLGTVEEGKLADLTVVDGDPFADFDALVRTVAVLRGGLPYEQADLVGAFAAAVAGAAGSVGAAGAAGDAADWAAVGEQLRRDGCCDVHV